MKTPARSLFLFILGLLFGSLTYFTPLSAQEESEDNNNTNSPPATPPANSGPPTTPADPITPQINRVINQESDDRINFVRTGLVGRVRDIQDLSFEDARLFVKSVRNLNDLRRIIKKFGTYAEFIDETGGISSLVHLLKQGNTLEEATDKIMDQSDDVIGEPADLINAIFQDATIIGGTLDPDRLFDRSRLFNNEFNVTMIATAAEMLGYEDIGNRISSSVSISSLNSNNMYIGELTSVLSDSTNLGLLGLGGRTKEIGNLFDLTTNDFEVFAGNNVTVDAGSVVDLAEFDTKVFAIVGGEELVISSDVTFSDRSSSWDKEVLAVGAAKELNIAPGSTVEYQGNYLGLGAGKNISLQQVTLKAGSGLGIGTIKNLTIQNSALELTNSKGGFGFFANNLIDIDGLTFAGNDVDLIYMEARTINLKNIDFPMGASVDLLSELGPIDGKYPNFGSSTPGRVNFISGVSYGGATNVMNDKPSFDQFGENINIKTF